jgi:hypothetical protein
VIDCIIAGCRACLEAIQAVASTTSRPALRSRPFVVRRLTSDHPIRFWVPALPVNADT